MSALLTARAVADMLGVSTETVLRWSRAGKLPAIRLPGGAIRYRPDELDEWLSSRATHADNVGPSIKRARGASTPGPRPTEVSAP